MRRSQAGLLRIVAGDRRQQQRTALKRSRLWVCEVGGLRLLAWRSEPIGEERNNLLGSFGIDLGRCGVTGQVINSYRRSIDRSISAQNEKRSQQAQRFVRAVRAGN